MCLRTLLIKTYHFAFDKYAVLWLETTFLVCQVAGLNGNINNSAQNWNGLGLSLAIRWIAYK